MFLKTFFIMAMAMKDTDGTPSPAKIVSMDRAQDRL
jgi:hypothetical protein